MIRSSAMCCRTVNNLLANFLERSCRSGGLVSDQSRPHAEIIIVLHSTELFRAQPARAGALYSLGASAGHGEIGAGVSDLKALCASAERGRRRPDRRPRTTRTWNEAPRPAGAGWCVPASRRARAPRRPRPLGISGSHLCLVPARYVDARTPSRVERRRRQRGGNTGPLFVSRRRLVCRA